MMTSLDHHHRHHHHHAQHHQLGMRLCELDSAMTSSTSAANTARWFRDDEYARCQSAHRHGNIGYPSPFFQHSQLQRRSDGSMTGHSWPFSVDGVAAAAAAAPWSLHPAGTPPWTAAVGTRRPGCRALEAWPVADNAASPITTRHHQHDHHHQQQYPQSPDDVSTPVPMHKYPWMSIIGELYIY